MKLYPENIESKLGFDKIRELLQEKCLSNLGIQLVDKIRFSTKPDHVRLWLGQTEEFVKIITSDENFPTNHFLDVSKALDKSKPEGVFLSSDELLNISNSLGAIVSCHKFFDKHQQEYPHLSSLLNLVEFDFTLPAQITEKIDKNGEIKDNASPDLLKVRNELKSRYVSVKKLVDKLFRNAVKSGYVPEGASMTVRDGRMVIPITAENKRRIKGFIHDESSTGSTVFIEPTEVLEGNNEIRELENAEKREEIKILTRLTDIIRVNLSVIKKGYQFLSFVDFIRAKALLALDMDATLPQLSQDQQFDLIEARHPLLYLSYKPQSKNVVPLTLQLNTEQRVLVISGPNAGGKSVCLKTVGLIQYMFQSGLLVPVGEPSTIGMFNNVFIDIGDEQSLENDLSTYSSHITNMKYFLTHADDNSLVLIDEFGTGTDPQFGGAIAEAVLDQLMVRKCQGVITTHFSNIKLYAEDHDHVVNGAMKFDMQQLAPLYELELGKPGSSFSLEISRKIGLDQHVIDYAKSVIGGKKADVDDLILKLEKQQQEIAERDESIKTKEKEVQNLEAKYTALYNELDENKKAILSKAKEEAASLLSKTNREIEKTIRHIKENKAQKSETKLARQRLESLKENVTDKKVAPKPSIKKETGAIEVGSQVLIEDKNVVGEVLAIRGKDIEVQIGGLKTLVKKSRVTKISNTQAKTQKRNPQHTRGMDIAMKRSQFSTTLDLRGKRGEEALPMVDKFLDDALLFNMPEVKILHGKGNGILKDMIRNHLKGTSFIASMHDEHIERGGAGITVLELV